jgi:hypothetical protein
MTQNKEAQKLETIDVEQVAGGHHHPYWGGGWGGWGGYYGARFAFAPPVAYAAAPVAYAPAAPVAYAAAPAAPTVVVYR